MTGGPAERRPIVVLGAPRSGTTVLTTLLEKHPDVHVEMEPRLVWRYGNDRRSDQLRPEHLTAEIAAHIRATFAARLAASGRTRLVEKTPSNSLRPAFVDAALDRPLLVHIVRNGWDSVAAIRAFWERTGHGFTPNQRRNVGRRLREARLRQAPHYAMELVRRTLPARGVAPHGPRLAGLRDAVRDLGTLEVAAMQWQACVTAAATYGRGLGDRYHELRFEDLSLAKYSELLRWAGLGEPSSLAEDFGGVFDPSVQTSRTLSPDERARVAPYVEPVHAWLGYE